MLEKHAKIVVLLAVAVSSPAAFSAGCVQHRLSLWQCIVCCLLL